MLRVLHQQDLLQFGVGVRLRLQQQSQSVAWKLLHEQFLQHEDADLQTHIEPSQFRLEQYALRLLNAVMLMLRAQQGQHCKRQCQHEKCSLLRPLVLLVVVRKYVGPIQRTSDPYQILLGS